MPDLQSLRPLIAEILASTPPTGTFPPNSTAEDIRWLRQQDGAATLAWCDAFEGDLDADEAFELERLASLEEAIDELLDDDLTPAKFRTRVRELMRG